MTRQPLDPAATRLALVLHYGYLWLQNSKASRRLYAAVCGLGVAFLMHHRHTVLSDFCTGAFGVGCIAALSELAAKSGMAIAITRNAYLVASGRRPIVQSSERVE